MSVEPDKAPESWADSMKAVAAELEAAEPAPDPIAEPQDSPTEQATAEPPAEKPADDEAAAPEPEVAEPAGDADASEPTALEPLQHWTKADKEFFSGLDETGKERWLDRAKSLEKVHNTKLFELENERRQYHSLMKAVEPFQEEMTLRGVSADQAVGQLVTIWKQMQSDPAATLSQLVRQYAPSMGTDAARQLAQSVLSAKGVHADALLEEPVADLDSPEANAIADVRRELQELRAERQQDRSTFEQSQHATAQQQIDGFRTATNGNGGLAHPHFDALQTNMGALIQAGLATGLEDAYTKALAMSPDLQPPVPKPNGKPVTKSSVAASSPAPGNPAREPAKSHREELANVARELGAI